MNKFIATLLVIAVAVNSAAAFTSQSPSLTTRTQQTTSSSFGPAVEFPSTSTALNLKVDPNSIKGNKNDKGNAKMAAYGGSVAVAVALPVLFLIWSQLSH